MIKNKKLPAKKQENNTKKKPVAGDTTSVINKKEVPRPSYKRPRPKKSVEAKIPSHSLKPSAKIKEAKPSTKTKTITFELPDNVENKEHLAKLMDIASKELEGQAEKIKLNADVEYLFGEPYRRSNYKKGLKGWFVSYEQKENSPQPEEEIKEAEETLQKFIEEIEAKGILAVENKIDVAEDNIMADSKIKKTQEEIRKELFTTLTDEELAKVKVPTDEEIQKSFDSIKELHQNNGGWNWVKNFFGFGNK